MRPVRYNVAASLDGFIATADGGYDWIPNDETIDFNALFKNVDTVLLGRTTYELVQQQPEKPWHPGTRVYVFSTTMRQQHHDGVTIINDNAADVVASLRHENGGEIWLFGGGKLFSSLLAAGQVDKVEIAVCPVLLHHGIPLSLPGTPLTKMTFESATPYPSGIVMLNYAVTHTP